MVNRKAVRDAEKLYDTRISSKMDAVDAAGQWGSKDGVGETCEEICSKIGIKKEDWVLEVGCGSGVLGSHLQTKCAFYCGFDVSNLMLKKFVDEYGSKCTCNLIQSVTDLIPLRNNLFDVVIMNSVTMYLHDQELLENTLVEIERVSTTNATIFIGDNIIPSGYYWELAWFQNLPAVLKPLAKPYIRIRKWIADKSPKLTGKWKSLHREISPEFVKMFFEGRAEIRQSNAAVYTVRQRILGRKYKGNRRVDFLITLK